MALSDILIRINGDSSAFQAEMSKTNKALNQVFSASNKATSGFAALGARMTSIGSSMTMGITLPLAAFGAATVKIAADMEALKAGLAATTKEAGPLEKQLARLQEVAKLPGLGLKEAIQGSTSLQAAGFSAQLAERSLKAFGNALATVGKGKAELDGVTLALSQIASKGKISAEEINQLAERVPQIRVAMKDAFGTADTEILQKAGIGAEEFVTKVVAQLEKLKQVTGGTKNSFENLSDTLTQAGDRIGQKLLPTVNAMIPQIEALIKAGAGLVDEFEKLDQPTQVFILGLTAAAAVAGPAALALGKVSSMFAEIGITAPLVGAALGGIVLAFESMKQARDIAVMLGDVVFQLDKITGVAGDAKQNVAFLKDQFTALSIQFPAVSDGARRLYDELSKLGTALAMPGFTLIKAALAPLITALEYATGRSRSMDDSIKTLNARLIEQGAQNIKLAADMKNFGGASEDAAGKVNKVAQANLAVSKAAKEAAEATKKAAEEAHKHSFAGLAEAESHSRIEAALRAGSIAWLDYTTAHELGGKKMAETRSELTWLTDAVAAYQAQLQKGIIQNLPTPIGMPELPNRPYGTTTGEIVREAGGETSATLRSRANAAGDAYERIIQLQREGKATAQEVKTVYGAWHKAEQAASGQTEKGAKASSKALQQVSTVVTDLSRGIAGIIFEGGKFGDMLQKVAKQAGQAITRELIEGALSKLSKKLLDVGGLFGTVFGGGTGVVKSVSGGMGDLGGAATGGIGGAATAASSGLAGIIGAAGSVVSAISGVIGNFQMAGMNKTLDLIEHEVRYSQIHLLNTLNKANEFWPYIKSVWESLIRMETAGGFGGGGGTVNVSMAGAYLMSDAQMGDFADRLARFLKARGI
jgi:tape measure domain-containing protein